MQRTFRSIKLSAPTSGFSLKIRVKMFSAKRMRFLFLMVVASGIVSSAKLPKLKKEPKPKSAATPAIIAIEIVDPNENKTSSKNSKRTIESSLGYGGYNSYQPPRYEVYKYSQHDIPPFRGFSSNHGGSIGAKVYDIQKSIEYDLGKHQSVDPSSYYQSSSGYTSSHKSSPNLGNYYQPGTTLYSTLNNNGQLSHLSANLPQQAVGGHVPVIILRVYPNQLSGGAGGLYAKLPQTHPFADNINSVNLQELLVKYVQNALVQQTPQQQVYQPPTYQQPTYTGHQDFSYQKPKQYYTQQTYQYQRPSYQYYHQYQLPTVYHTKQKYVQEPNIPTYENYPDDAHTRVVFKEGFKSPTPAVAYKTEEQPQYEYGTPETQPQVDEGSQQQAQGYYYERPQQQQPEAPGYYPEVVDNYKKEGPESFQFDISQFLPQQYTQEAEVPPEAEDGKDEPYNYHAHGEKNARSKKNSSKAEKKSARDKRDELE